MAFINLALLLQNMQVFFLNSLALYGCYLVKEVNILKTNNNKYPMQSCWYIHECLMSIKSKRATPDFKSLQKKTRMTVSIRYLIFFSIRNARMF